MILFDGGKTLQFKLFIDNLTLKIAVNHWAWITDSMNSRITKTDSVTWIKQFLKYKFTNSMDNYYDFVSLVGFDIFSQRLLSLLNAFFKISPFVFHKVIWFWNDIRICRYWHMIIFFVWTVPLPLSVNQPWNIKMRLPPLSTVHKMNKLALLAIKYEHKIIQND